MAEPNQNSNNHQNRQNNWYNNEPSGNQEPNESVQEKELRLEMEHFNGIVSSFGEYERWQMRRFETKQSDWLNLPEHYINMIPNMPQKFKYIKFCLQENQKFMNQIIEPPILSAMMGEDHLRHPMRGPCKPMDLDKVKSTLRQCLRDWSEVGKSERDMCYQPILQSLENFFPDVDNRKNIRVLNPGCGLGRLTWEIANMGFQSQGNEFSYHMLLASNLLLNQTKEINQFTIYPYIDAVANVWRFRDQCRKITIPDVYPRSLPSNSNFSMTAGDFLEVYTTPDSWDVVVTCFFIDTAKNVFDYLTTLSTIVPTGGYWINLGPLLYHFEDMAEASIELTYEELRAIIPQFGFEFVEERLGVSSTYARNELSMLQMAYNSAFFVCRKLETPSLVKKQQQEGTIWRGPSAPPSQNYPEGNRNNSETFHPEQQQREFHGHNQHNDNSRSGNRI